MKGLIGKKVGMTNIYMEDGTNVQATIIEAGPCVVTQIKTEDTDGYNAVQLGFGERKDKRTTKALRGHFEKAGTTPKQKLVEFRDFGLDVNVGDVLGADIFEEGEAVDITGRSKGKGFQGVVKRHGFHGVGMATHGQHNRLRAPGSIGMSSTPSRVFKGMRMGGRTGGVRSKIQDLVVMKVLPESNMLVVTGAVPGPKGAYVLIEKEHKQ